MDRSEGNLGERSDKEKESKMPGAPHKTGHGPDATNPTGRRGLFVGVAELAAGDGAVFAMTIDADGPYKRG
jgi:hypothetical protein